MAQVKIYGLRGELAPRREKLSQAIHQAVMEVLGMPAGKRAHRFFPLEQEDFLAPEGRTKAYTILELQMIEGRTKETKKALVQRLFQLCESEAEILPVDLEIVILEAPPENWGFRGFCGDEVKLDYQIKV